jgi:hypothetical protein
MAISLRKALTEERSLDLGRGVTVRVKPVGFARFARLNAESLMRAQAELAAAGAGEPSSGAVAVLSQKHLDAALIVESITGWDGVEGEDGLPAPVTAEAWALFADLCPDLASIVVAEIRHPGILAVYEGNASAPSPNGAPAGARNIAAAAPNLPATRASPAPGTAARARAPRKNTDRSPGKGATSPRP